MATTEPKITTIGVVSTLLKASVYPAAASRYRSIGSHMKQLTAASAGVLLIAMLILPFPGEAQAACRKCATENKFFDFDYAKRMWIELRTRDQLEAEWARVGTQYEAAQQQGVFDGTVKEVRARIEVLPNAEQVMQGHDLDLAYNGVWIPAVEMQPGRAYGSFNNAAGNVAPKSLACNVTIMRNIFTHQCFDLPDWRTEELAAADTAKFQEIQRKK